jgi:hypothetical protein
MYVAARRTRGERESVRRGATNTFWTGFCMSRRDEQTVEAQYARSRHSRGHICAPTALVHDVRRAR